MVIDIILCAALAAAFAIGFRRGLLRTMWGLAALILTIALTGMLRPYAADAFKSSNIADGLRDYVYTRVESGMSRRQTDMDISYDYPDMVNSAYSLPDTYAKNAINELREATENTITTVTDTVTNQVVDIAASVLLFVSIRFVLAAAYRIVKYIFKLPLLKQSNHLLGGAAQLLIALIVIYAVLAGAAIIGSDIAKDTVLCEFMYNHNLLLGIIGA